MSETEGLLDAAVDVLGQRVMTKDELRSELSARSVELGEPDQYGLDELDRLVQLTPQIGHTSIDHIAHLPSLYAGIAWSVPITDDDARNGFIVATPLLEPLVEMMLDGNVAMIDADDTALGNALVDGAEIDGSGVDVVIPPSGLLTQLAGQVATMTIIDAFTLRIEAGDQVDGPDAQLAAVRTAFETHAELRTITRPIDGSDVELTTAPLSSVVASMVVADRDAFTASQVPPIDDLIEAAGLSIHRGMVGQPETDWGALVAWQMINMVQLNHELTDEQAAAYAALVAAPVTINSGTGSPAPTAGVTAALDDAKVAELAWTEWTDSHLVGEGLDAFVETLGDSATPGVEWIRARQLMLSGDTDGAIALLEGARSSGHAMVLADLAGFAADRSEPLAAKALLDEAGVMTDVDLDEEYDPVTSTSNFGRELAEEIAPFAAIRPRAMAGRNDPCPCGSGRKYKQCHLGNELHEIEHRAGWLYVKMMRFMQLTNPAVPGMIADTIVSDVESADLRTMLRQSYLPIDMAFHEGRVADRFLDAKRSLLPRDEAELVERWIDTTRSVYEVVRSTADSMDVIDLATRDRLTVRDTVPEEPLEAGWKVIGRLVPVGDSYRAYSGFLPVNDDMVDVMLQGFGTRQLEMVAITIGQIFQTAETHDGMQSLFDDSVDDSELRALIEQMAVEMSDDAETGGIDAGDES